MQAAFLCFIHARRQLRDAPVGGDEHGAVHDVQAAGGEAGRERRVPCDHRQLVAALLQLPQRRLALWALWGR